ncbi:MAG: cupin domain-containing protein [Clostridiales bacterium]|jgi:quercetin dioxygenase-like cupin family protein|nr:cupin domain-containing protein [Clostridiales bacterium]
METKYNFSKSNEKLIEKIIDNDEVMINHMVLNKGDSIPEHNSNSNVYIIIVNGMLTLQLAGNPAKGYEQGDIVNIPFGVKMNITNGNDSQAEFFVIKAPSPRAYPLNQKTVKM